MEALPYEVSAAIAPAQTQSTPKVEKDEQLTTTKNNAPDASAEIAANGEHVPGGDGPGLCIEDGSGGVTTDRHKDDPGPVEESSEHPAVVDVPDATPLDGGAADAPLSSRLIPAKVRDSGNENQDKAGDDLAPGMDDRPEEMEHDTPKQAEAIPVFPAGSRQAVESTINPPARAINQADVNAAALQPDSAEAVDDAPFGENPEPETQCEPSTLAGDEEAGDEAQADNNPCIDDEEEAITEEETRPCPRCGATCESDEVEQVFSYRTMRRAVSGVETTAVRRQSYCRQCRTEHAAEMRGRAEPKEGRSDLSDLGDVSSSPVGDDGQVINAAEESYGSDSQAGDQLGDLKGDDAPDLHSQPESQGYPNDSEGTGPDLSKEAEVSEANLDEKLPDQQQDDKSSPPDIEPEILSNNVDGVELSADETTDVFTVAIDDEMEDERGINTTADESIGSETLSDSDVDVEIVDEGENGGASHETIDSEAGSDQADPQDAVIREGLDVPEREPYEVREDERRDNGTHSQVVEPELIRVDDADNSQTGDEDRSPAPEPSNHPLPAPATPIRSREERRPPQYRAPAGGPSPLRQSSGAGSAPNSAGASPSGNRPALIEVRVLFERGGYCTVALLARRPPGLPEELTVSSVAGEAELVALQDEWYQDVVPEQIADLLRTGFVWTHQNTGQEWLLSGREVFVLAAGTAHRGFVSCPRLVLGRDHVVLCATSRLPAVEEVLRETGCAGWTNLGVDDGVPAGWTVLRGITPQRSAPLSNDADILNVLKPLPEIEIALEGGIRLAYNSWLVGYPPAIRVYGDPEHTEKVLVDGQESITSSENRYTAPGWDEVGSHQIWCSNTTKGYSLVRCETSWRVWSAYSFPRSGSRQGDRGFTFCGPLVRPADDSNVPADEPCQSEGIQIPSSNPILLGPKPGQVLFARKRNDVRGALCIAFPPFAPVWALPAQPLLCDKRTNCILLVGQNQPVAAGSSAVTVRQKVDRRAIERWCRLILDGSRKGLAVEPAGLAATQLWSEYKRYAKSVWRKLR